MFLQENLILKILTEQNKNSITFFNIFKIKNKEVTYYIFLINTKFKIFF